MGTFKKMLSVTNHQWTTSQNHYEIVPHTSQDGYYKKKKTQKWMTSVGKDMEKLEPL